MALSESAELLAHRIRTLLYRRPGYNESRMFGGLCFLLDGNMCCGVTKDARLMVRVGPDVYEDVLREPHAAEMDFTGRPMKGMVFVNAPGFASDQRLAAWVALGTAFCERLPKKLRKAPIRKTR